MAYRYEYDREDAIVRAADQRISDLARDVGAPISPMIATAILSELRSVYNAGVIVGRQEL